MKHPFYHKISRIPEATRLVVWIIALFWHLTVASVAALLTRLPQFRVIGRLWPQIGRLQNLRGLQMPQGDLLSLEKANAKQKREEEFVFLEQRSAHVLINAVGKVVVQILQALVQVCGWSAVVYRLQKLQGNKHNLSEIYKYICISYHTAFCLS